MQKRKVGSVNSAGVDVGSRELVVRLRPGTGASEALKFENTPEGHQALLGAIRKMHGRTRVALEATGTYHLDLALTLARAKRVEVMVVNPLASRRFAQANMRRAKTDKVDAAVLLEFCERMPFTPWSPPRDVVLHLRAIARHLHSQVTDKVALGNRLSAAKATGSTPAFVLQDLAEQIEAMETRIVATEAAAVALARTDPELAAALVSLDSIPGIALRSGVQLLGELVMLDPTMTPDEVVAHAGLDPRPKQSGTVDSPRKISKQGNARIRGVLYMPALTASWSNPVVAAWYDNLIGRGKAPFVAHVAVMRRLLRVAWVLMGTKGAWDGTKFAPFLPKASAQAPVAETVANQNLAPSP